METQSAPKTRILLWSAPRNLSSIFERSVRELNGVKVFYEPHQAASLYGPERIHRVELPQDILAAHADSTYDRTDDILLEDFRGFSATFVKNMAFFIPRERFDIYTCEKFSSYQHTFLIRNPHEAILSRWKVSQRSDVPFPCWDDDAYKKMYELFYHIATKLKEEIVVVDAADLQRNPEQTLKQYCDRTGLIFDKKMLTWTPGIVQDWTCNPNYEMWHYNAMFSDGFNKTIKYSAAAESYPQIVEDHIQKAMPYYELMYKHRMKIHQH